MKNFTAFRDEVKKCVEVLAAGGTILYPTDTVWGLGADATNAEAVSKIYATKERAETKSMIILLSDEKDIEKYVAQLPDGIFDFLKMTSKPTTVIYSSAKALASNAINENGSIAIRIVQDDFCKEIINRLGSPIISTSANKSGDPSPQNFKTISEAVKKEVDYVCSYRQEEAGEGKASRIVIYGEDGAVTVIRE